MTAHAAKEERLDRYSESILDAVKSAFVRIAVVVTSRRSQSSVLFSSYSLSVAGFGTRNQFSLCEDAQTFPAIVLRHVADLDKLVSGLPTKSY